MKKRFLFTTILMSLLLLISIQNKMNATTVQPVDYSNKANWMYMETNTKKEVDLLYFYPTATYDSPDGSGIGIINDKNKKQAKDAFAHSGAAFSSYTNVYAPYYRQVAATKIADIKDIQGLKEFLKNSQAKKDVFDSLDYYFNNLNNGRPFIISSHSQGSFIMQLAFEEYFSKHPKYLDRMVAAYIVGIPISNKWLKQNHLKFAKKETDTGVIITWNTEGPNAKGGSNIKQMVINPINWKRNETPASVEENKGSLNYQTFKVEKGFADATINKKRGTVICTTNKNYIKPLAFIFGDTNLHFYDYTFYYENIKENGLKRIEAYLGHKAK